MTFREPIIRSAMRELRLREILGIPPHKKVPALQCARAVRLRPGVKPQSDRIHPSDRLRVLATEVWGDRSCERYVRVLVVNQRGQWAGSFLTDEIEVCDG